KGQVARGSRGLGQLDAQLAGAGLGMVLERGGFQIRHVGASAFYSYVGTDRDPEHTARARSPTRASPQSLEAACQGPLSASPAATSPARPGAARAHLFSAARASPDG